jgi:hypothetical protein
MLKEWTSQTTARRVVEDPDQIGYRLVSNVVLDVMDAEGWYRLERAATRTGPSVEPRRRSTAG